MRLIGMLLALLLVAYLVNKQLGSGEADPPAQDIIEGTSPDAPKIPTNSADVEQYGEDMQKYLDDQVKKRAEAIRELEEG